MCHFFCIECVRKVTQLECKSFDNHFQMCHVRIHLQAGSACMSMQALGGIPLGFGIVVEEKPFELLCTIIIIVIYYLYKSPIE